MRMTAQNLPPLWHKWTTQPSIPVRLVPATLETRWKFLLVPTSHGLLQRSGLLHTSQLAVAPLLLASKRSSPRLTRTLPLSCCPSTTPLLGRTGGGRGEVRWYSVPFFGGGRSFRGRVRHGPSHAQCMVAQQVAAARRQELGVEDVGMTMEMKWGGWVLVQRDRERREDTQVIEVVAKPSLWWDVKACRSVRGACSWPKLHRAAKPSPCGICLGTE